MSWLRSKQDPNRRDTPPADSFTAGRLLPGTSADVDHDAPDRGAAAIQARDDAFRPDAFVDWAAAVYAMATATWRTGDTAKLRSVMTEAVWEPYAELLRLMRILPVGQQLMGSATATARLVGAATDDAYDTVVVAFDAALAPTTDVQRDLAGDAPPWVEWWTFQRPAGSVTHASGAVAVCPNCGAPAAPDGEGACPYCHADIASRTAGWLVTRTTTTMRGLVRTHARLAASAAEHVPPAPPSPTADPPPGPPTLPPRAG